MSTGLAMRAGALVAGVAGLAMLAACGQTAEEAPPEPAAPAAEETPAPVAADAFKYAAIYDCGPAGEIKVLQETGADGKPLAKVLGADGVATDLPMLEGTELPTFTNGRLTITSTMDGNIQHAVGKMAPTTCQGVSRAIDPPAVEGAVADVRDDGSGKASVTVAPGQTFAVSLVGVPTAGYVWDAGTLPAFIEKTAEAGGPTSTAQLMPGYAGGNHWEVLVFKAVSAGEGELVITQKRPWEDAPDPDASTFRVTVSVK
jgi:predicted secreted protein